MKQSPEVILLSHLGAVILSVSNQLQHLLDGFLAKGNLPVVDNQARNAHDLVPVF